jgi:hypothetical protein
MKRSVLTVLLLTLAVPCLAFGQAQTAPLPKPGPEVQKLGAWVGTWEAEGEAKASMFSPAGKVSGTATCEWFAGGFHVVCRGEGTSPAGRGTELTVLAYDTEARLYTYFGITSRGETDSEKGTVAGDTWTWLWEGKVEGKTAKARITFVQVSPTVRTYKSEASVADGPWTLIAEGKNTKVK